MSALSILAEECELLNDSKYRSYITQVDKALKSFEYTSEWADLISALGKLNKVLLGHVKYPVIPKRVTIGKRLAQCLHPALPSGVHLKALETYDIIFKCIGTQRLAQDLFIYSAGLFPLLSHASMSVKPTLLTLYERHFVALGKHIKPGLNGMLLGLLPGLEEGSEFYERTNALMEDFCESTDPEYFYTCIWECVMSCPSVRLPAICYLLSHFNKKKTMEDQLYMMGLNIDLMVEAICNAIQDQMVLVQRSLLDFLLLAFPMHNGQLTKADMGKIVRAVINVVLRRDMSLNRRLYAWLLGSNSRSGASMNISGVKSRSIRRSRSDLNRSISIEVENTYFDLHSKEPLIQALKDKLSYSREEEEISGGIKTETRTAVLKPFRILMSLLDKPEIGPVILESVLLSVFRCLYRECRVRGSEEDSQKKEKESSKVSQIDARTKSELVKTANLLFAAFEPFFIWDYIARMFEESCSLPVSKKNSSHISWVQETDIPTLPELCQLVDYLLEVVSLETFLETQTEHLPELLYRITVSLTTHCSYIKHIDIHCTLELCSNLLAKVQPSNTILGMDSSSVDMVFDKPSIPQHSASTEHPTPQNKENIEKAEEKCKPQNKDDSEKTQEPNTDSPLSENKEDCEEITGAKEIESPKDKNTEADKNVEQNGEEVKNSSVSENDSEKIDETKKKDEGLSRQDSVSKPPTMMQACVECFKNFFHTYITQKIFQDSNISAKFVQSIVLPSSFSHYSDEEDSLLDTTSMYSMDLSFSHTKEEQNGQSETLSAIAVEHLTKDSIKTFSCACRLLLDYSSFPIYCTDYHQILNCTYSTEENMNLPQWLQDLITCCCFVRHFEIQSSAMATLLDLIIVAQTVQSDSEHKDDLDLQTHKSVSEGTVSVVIIPALLPVHLKYLSEMTIFFKRVAQILWEYLNESTPSYHLQSVELFHQLHQITPSSWVCEDVVGNALVTECQSSRIEAFKKFTVLWHLTRSAKDSTPGHPPRSFDRSMFVLLDSLKEDSSPIKTIASTWLVHVIQRGDICRVLNPLLAMLLHPDTARVSVQHINVHQPKKVRISESEEEVDHEARIYAISSEGGNIIYHVSADSKKISGRTSEDLKSLTVTDKKGLTFTDKAHPHHDQELLFQRVQPEDLYLRVNPFGSQQSLDRNIFEELDIATSQQFDPSAFKRLDKDTCVKEGIFFDGNDAASQSSTDASSQGEVSADAIAEEILQEIIDRVVPPELQSCELDEEDIEEEEEEEVVSAANFDGELTKPERRMPSFRRKLSISSKTSSMMEDHDILNSVDSKGMEVDSPTASELDLSQPIQEEKAKDKTYRNIHALHMHMLLYTQKYDYKRTLYALNTIKSMLVTCPRLVVTAMVTTSISANRMTQLAKLQMLLARHRKSVFGKNFFGELPPEVMSGYRSNMFIEVIISICLYFIRSYYPNLMMSKLSQEELLGNKEVHIQAAEILTLLLSELISIMKESGKSFVSYIKDLLTRCKLQKALLHCCLASVYNMRNKESNVNSSKITEAIITFNEENLDPSANETFQIRLLNLMLVVIMLEGRIEKMFGDKPDQIASAMTDWERPRVNFQQSLMHVKYNASLSVVQQGMFSSCLLSALKQTHMRHMHRHWVAMVTSALPYMGKVLPNIVINVVAQLCRNIEAVAIEFEDNSQRKSLTMPADHILTMIEGLTTICHYCLLDSASPVSIGLPAPTTTNITVESGNTGHILTNLIHVFNPIGNSRETSPQRDIGPLQPVLDARRSLLSIMPRIIACMASLWKAVNVMEEKDEHVKGHSRATWIMGSPKVIRQKLLEFISPISLPHGTNLLGAVGVAWNDRRKKTGGVVKKVMSPPSEDQLLLVNLVSAVKVLPTDTLVQTVKQVLKQPPPTDLGRVKKSVPLEVNMLQFFYSYVQQTSAGQLVDSWTALLSLFRESLQLNLSPLGKFLLLQILNEFVQKMPSMEDKKNQKELQEISQKLLEAVALIAGSSLEQTTWLRRNLAVKPGPQIHKQEVEEEEEIGDDSEIVTDPVDTVRQASTTVDSKLLNAADSKYSVQALLILAELTAPLLDVVYSSEEKEKVAPFLATIMYNVFPYLRNHSSHNLPSYRACSKILASVSGYQYTRKAWRKEALELLLDQSFFQMDVKCIGYWRAVIDNLMTHDKTTFKDLMSRVTMAQSGSLSLFSSKEQELEQRSHMLKRLAFTIFCSEPDQYQKAMPEIQERLAESLRLPHQVPSVMAQVFLCFRVLILRMSHHHLTSLWPTVITEMVHVFMQIEQELSNDTDEYKSQIQKIAALDSTWAHLGNGLNAHNNPAWLQLYLSVSKLLDLALALPADVVPQFQLYRWAFIGGAAAGNQDMSSADTVERNEKKNDKKKVHFPPEFVPHVIRLTKLMNERVKGATAILKQTPGRPLLTMSHLRSLAELQPFFNTLCCTKDSGTSYFLSHQPGSTLRAPPGQQMPGRFHTFPKSQSNPEFGSKHLKTQSDIAAQSKTNRQYVEELVERDFLEPLNGY